MLPNTATPFEVTVDHISDILTAVAYFSIPLELLYFLKHYPTTIPNKYKSIVVMFALFIVLCGYKNFNSF
jgi:ethylene receptor